MCTYLNMIMSSMHVHTHNIETFNTTDMEKVKVLYFCSYQFYSQLYELSPTRLMMVHSYRHTIIIFSHKCTYINTITYTHTETFKIYKGELVLIYKTLC